MTLLWSSYREEIGVLPFFAVRHAGSHFKGFLGANGRDSYHESLFVFFFLNLPTFLCLKEREKWQTGVEVICGTLPMDVWIPAPATGWRDSRSPAQADVAQFEVKMSDFPQLDAGPSRAHKVTAERRQPASGSNSPWPDAHQQVAFHKCLFSAAAADS